MSRALRPLLAALALAAAACRAEEVPQTPPRQVSESPFHYPEELWDAQVEGQTVLRIHITAEGTVDSAQVDQGSGYPAFDSAAVAGSRALRFEPATRGGEPVAAWFLLPVQFALPPSEGATDSTAQETP